MRLPVAALLLASLLPPSADAATLERASYLVADEPLELRLEISGPLAYDWHANAALAFEIRQGDGVRHRASGNRANETFLPDTPGPHVVSWGSTADVTLRWRLDGDFAFLQARGLHDLDPAAYAAAPGLLLSLLAFGGSLRRRN